MQTVEIGQDNRAAAPAHRIDDAERRGGERRADRRTVAIEADGRRGSFTLRNVSTRGAAGSADVPLAEGLCVSLFFDAANRIAGRVRWIRGMLAGIEFSSVLPFDLLDGNRQGKPVDRPPRYNVQRAAIVSAAGQVRGAVVKNVSTSGMKIESTLNLIPGERVLVSCGAMGPIEGRVRWSRVGPAGIMLVRQISIEQFEIETAGAAL